MKVITSIQEMSQFSAVARKEGKTIGFVPTMGALHRGHLELVKLSQSKTDSTVVSIFVNPTQFGPQEDFNAYPRQFESDSEKLQKENVDVLFAPTDRDMYGSEFQTSIDVKEVSKWLCGEFRPGHFQGVATVVLKLFNIVRPQVAVFGEKDYQQLLVIKHMVCDLNLDVNIVSHPLVRDSDGLALSSRNVRLSQEEKKEALIIPATLARAQEFFNKGEREVAKILTACAEFIDREGSLNLQYLEIRDALTLKSISKIERKAVVLLAAHVGNVRLIDNCILGSDHETSN